MGQPAARLTDMHVCPMVTGIVPHVGGPIIMGSFNVFTGKLPQAKVTDPLVCVGPPDMIVKGSTGVFVNNMPAARLGDLTAHGGVIVMGLPTVLIGETMGGGGGGAGGPPMSGSASATAGGGTVSLAFTNFQQQVQTLLNAAKTGAPFCEACFAAAKRQLKDELG